MDANNKCNKRKKLDPKKKYYRNKCKKSWTKYDVKPPSPDSESTEGIIPYNSGSSSSAIVVDVITAEGPYEAWRTYFPCRQYDESDSIVKKLQIAKKYLLKIVDSKRVEMESTESFVLDIRCVSCDEDIMTEWPCFLDNLKNAPTEVIDCFGLAMHHILQQERALEMLQQPSDPDVDKDEEISAINSLPIVRAQFAGSDVIPLKNLKVNTYEKFVSVKGTVTRVGNINAFCSKLAFKCNRCSSIQVILQPNGNYTVPNKCISKPCSCHSFEPLRHSPLTHFSSWQSIRLQELITDDTCDKGRVPRTVECELHKDLVNRCVPGDIVTVSGIVKIIDPKEKMLGSVVNKSTYVLYIMVNHIESLKDKKADSIEVMPGGLNLGVNDLYTVRDIHKRNNLFNLIIASLCPNIYGHEIIKAGLVLSLFGGTHRYIDDDNRVPVRGDSHILIVGDPGLGKSQMLLACANVSPRGVYVCGNTSTSSGLTVTVTKEAGGENGLDAGALILADQGCCCIDEFDKMTNQHHALLEAMEQQTISIAKCGMSCILPARTSIIAAANPVGGHYNKSKTVAENIKLGSALLSRFDLVFIAIDKADSELDQKLSSYVMALHNGNNKSLLSLKNHEEAASNNCSLLDGKSNLIQYFKLNEEQDTISVENLRKYIAYARKYVQPKLSQEAAEILHNFYIDLRKQHQTPTSTPITNRQLESMIRLTEARARVELREVCTAKDAQIVVEIMKYSMVDTYSDEFGNMDFERSIHGSGSSKQAKSKKFLSILNSYAVKKNTTFFTSQQLEDIAKDIGMDTSKFQDFVDSLNYQGYLIKKGPKLFCLQTI